MQCAVRGQLTGTSVAVSDLEREIARAACSDAKVLVTGEPGTGKQLVAREIHGGSRRARAPFASVNCGGFSETMLESELFGHLRGSFPDAFGDKAGTFETANRGTVFLDEVGDMTLRMQALVLRFLETGELQKVGADHVSATVDVRVIAATTRSLPALVESGGFREDLFYRLNVIHVHVPALRERREDIPALIEHFFDQLVPEGRGPVMTPEALSALQLYSWPGNVRELLNVVERLAVTAREGAIGLDDLPPEVVTHRPAAALRPPRERRQTVADSLFRRVTHGGGSFWTVVYPLYRHHEITREDLREIVHKGLVHTRGNYRVLVRVFNMVPEDYRRFLSFLRKQACLLPYRDYR